MRSLSKHRPNWQRPHWELPDGTFGKKQATSRKGTLATVGTRRDVFQKRKMAPLAVDMYSREKPESTIVPTSLLWTSTWNAWMLESQGRCATTPAHCEGARARKTTMWHKAEYKPKSLK
mmetsp:Transcript_26680/g.73323  ORF Transcript_26680/g.73323 Transcript_26680/m.73323 type:complete len:119 (-) Transcript_26680:568-924(-)